MKTPHYLTLAAALLFSLSFGAVASESDTATTPCNEEAILERAGDLASENCDVINDEYISQARLETSCQAE